MCMHKRATNEAKRRGAGNGVHVEGREGLERRKHGEDDERKERSEKDVSPTRGREGGWEQERLLCEETTSKEK